MISIKLNCSKLDKTRLFNGKNGMMADLVLFTNKNGPDDYGNDGFVKQSCTKEERERGVMLPIVGNWKHLGQSAPRAAASEKLEPPVVDESDSVPF